MDSIVNRLKEYLLYKGISPSVAETEINVSNGTLSKPFNSGTTIKTNTLEKFLESYKDINPEWLLTGIGNMSKENLISVKSINKQKGLPLIPIDAMAGFGTGAMQIMDYDTSYYEVPEFTELKAEFMIRVKGASMTPRYHSGDLLACKKISLGTFFQWNKVYVLDTEQGALVKRVKPSDKEGCIKLVSDNLDYDPFDINITDIYAIACVIGVIRLE